MSSSQCDELEDAILLALDDTAKQLQASNSRHTRSGQYEKALLARHPGLKEKIS